MNQNFALTVKEQNFPFNYINYINFLSIINYINNYRL